MSRFVILLFALASGTIGCSPVDRKAELHDALEAVFRYQFKNNSSAVQQNAKAYFLSIENKDPSQEFLSRFANHSPPVRKGSGFAIGDGLEFRIGSWKWVSRNKLEVAGGYYEHGESSSGNRYTVVRKDDQWVVEKDVMGAVS